MNHDDHLRHIAEAGERHDRRIRQREQNSAAEIIAPRRTATPIIRPNNALLGSVQERDNFADEMLRRERANDANRQATFEDEIHTEGRQPRWGIPERASDE